MAKILFVSRFWFESLGIMQLSALLKSHGHDVQLLMTSNKEKILKTINETGPDVVAFSVFTGEYVWTREVAEFIKNNKNGCSPYILLGGLHPTFMPDVINDDPIDIICRGEGEYAFLDLMNTIAVEGDISMIKNLWVKENGKITKNELRPLIRDLDELPIPDRSIYYRHKYFLKSPSKNVMASRGCPFPCSFCFNDQFKGLYKGEKYNRQRSPRHVVEELKKLKEIPYTKLIFFVDDIFSLDIDWLKEFSSIYRSEIQLPFSCNLRSGIESEETIRLIAEAGCFLGLFSLETGNEALRRDVLKKSTPNKNFVETARLLKKYKINSMASTMYGFPGSDEHTAWETIEFIRKLNPEHMISHCFVPYPGTLIYDDLLNKNEHLKEKLNEMDTIYSKSEIMERNEREMKIYKLSYLLVRIPRLTSTIKRMVYYVPDWFAGAIFRISIGLSYRKRRKIGWGRLFSEIIHNFTYK